MPDEAPYRNYNFTVEIEGISEVAFAEVDVPGAWIDVVEYREGGDKVSSARKLPARAHYGTLVLRRGVTNDVQLYQWFAAVRDGNLVRRAVRIALLDNERQPVRVWRLSGAFPVKYAGPTLDAKGREVVIEEIAIVGDRLEVEAVG
jgi:phage tail-like protein